MDKVRMADFEVPFLDISVPAGFPSPAADYMEDRINLNNHLIKNPLSTFIIRCSGDSMINAFIPPRCYLVVDKSLTPNNGDIVVVQINREWTVKYLRKNDHKCWLIPANSKYREIEVSRDADFLIWGVVTAIISNPKELKNVCTD